MPGVSELHPDLGKPSGCGYCELRTASGSRTAGQHGEIRMTTSSPAIAQSAKHRSARLDKAPYALRRGILKLLAIKDSDVRLLILEQCRYAVDQGLHAGGAFSATIPLVALYYGGFLNIDVEDPARAGQDTFVLSKGH